MRIPAILLLSCFCLASVAAAAEDGTPRAHTIDDYLDGRPPLLAPETGGILGIFQAQLHVWAPELTGDLTVESGEILDIENDLGIDDIEFTVMPQFQLKLLGLGLRFDAFFLTYDGSSLLSRTFTFGGAAFQLNEQISTELSIDQIRIMFLIPLIDLGNVALSAQIGAAGLFLDGTVVGATTGSASRSEEVVIPLIGAVLQAKLGPVLLEVDVLGMTIDYDTTSGTIIDLRVSVGTTFLEVVAVHVGYRHILIEGEGAGFFLDVTLTGFFVGVSIQF